MTYTPQPLGSAPGENVEPQDAGLASTERTRRTYEEPRPRGMRWWREIGWRHVVGLAAVAFAAFPVLYVISASVNPLGTIGTTGLIPTRFGLDNYAELLSGDRGPFLTWYVNTLVLCAVVTVGQVLASALAAYAFSRFRFRGRRGGLLTILLIQMFPQFLAIVALFNLFSRLGEAIPQIGLNTLAGYGLILMGGAMGQVWLIKGFFDSIPRDLDEAAIIDGATHTQVYFRIILPLVRPILAVTGLLAFVGAINEFIIASIFLTDDSVKTLAVGLYGIIDGDRSNNLGVFAAGAVLTALPVVLLFQYLQKYIVGGLTAGSVKG